jgi:phosphopantetheine adenylyltransferase
VFAFGRFQPPTIGHELLVKAVKKLAGSNADHVIYASKTEDKKDNPLPVDRKVYFLKRMFPDTNFVAASPEVRTFIEAVKQLNKKYKNLVMVAGSDRVPEYTKILNKYNGTDEFNFDTIEVVSAGERDPDSDSASGMSGTKMRDAAKAGDFKKFKTGVPHTLTDLDARRLMNDIRKAYALAPIKESFEFERTKLREKYVAGKIFNIGDKVKDDNGVYEIMDRGTNYITVVNESGELTKKFLDKVKAVKSVTEDIQGGYAPEEITYKGYTTHNLHHAPDAAKAFQETIERAGDKDPVAVLNALKATDTYMKLNDMHLEQEKAPDAQEVKEWIASHLKAKDCLERVGEFMHHMDYWDDHGHELQMMFLNYKDTGKDDAYESLELEGNMIQEQLKFASADKIKVARIIATTFGVENADKASSPEQMVNNGLRKIRNKSFTPDMAKVIKNMLDTARLAGIDFDEKLLPAKVTAVQENTVNKKSNYNAAKDILRYKDFQKLKAVQEDKDPSTKKDTESDHDEEGEQKPKHTHGGHLMASPLEDSNVRRQRIRYAIGEATDAEKAAKESAKASLGAKQAKEKETLAMKQAKEREALSEGERGLWDNIHAKQKRIKAGSGEKMRKPGSKGAPTDAALKASQESFEQTFDVLEEAVNSIDKGEYDYEGQMARTQLQTILRNSEDLIDMIGDDENMPEWVQSKITLAQDYITTVRDYLQSREELEEKAPPGFEGTVKAMKKHPEIDNPYALSWYLKNKGAKSHRKADGSVKEDLDEEHIVHVDDGSNYGDKPHDKDVEHVMSGAKKHGGEFDGHSDKGAFFKFKSKNDAKNFADHVKKAPHKSVHADLHEKIEHIGPVNTNMINHAGDEPHDEEWEDAGICMEHGKKDCHHCSVKKEEVDLWTTAQFPTSDVLDDEEDQELTDADIEKMIEPIDELEDIIDEYDEDEYHFEDEETGEQVPDDELEEENPKVNEAALLEVLSRSERIRQKIRFAKTSAKRKRSMRIALKTHSSTAKINTRARRLAIKLMKQRIAKKPLNSLSVGEKERLERIIHKRKAVINRVAMKLTSRIRKIENNRLSGKKSKGSSNVNF